MKPSEIEALLYKALAVARIDAMITRDRREYELIKKGLDNLKRKR